MKKIFLSLSIITLTLASCQKEKSLNVDLTKKNTDTYVKGELDLWLDDKFLNPYNIDVLYRFDRFQADVGKEVSPVQEVKVKPIMEGVESIFIKPYLELTNKAFLYPLLPKVFALYGTGQFSNGQKTLGTADAGRQINLFDVNNYDKTSRTSVLGSLETPAAFHTIHHEFAHILHQNVPLPPGYEEISSNYVGSSWVGAANTTTVSKSLGFITRYARNNKNEDFAEMVATLLVAGQDAFDVFVLTADASAAGKLRRKEQMVVDYFRSSYDIDFRALQEKVKLAMETYAPVTITQPMTFFNQGLYAAFSIDKGAANQSTALVTAFNTANTAVKARTNLSLIDAFELSLENSLTSRANMVLKIRIEGGLEAWYNLTATVNATANTIAFARRAAGTGTPYANGTTLDTQCKTILDYFTTRTFTLGWVDNIIPNSRYKNIGFTDRAAASLGFHALIIKNKTQ